MNKVYLLLRNNKQQGPFTLEELLQQSLKPYDLIWLEGRSAGWKYPGEIEALKPYVPEPIDQAIQEKEIAVSSQAIELKEPVVAATKKIKPIRIFISLPSVIHSTVLVQQEESPEQKLEKKAEELLKRTQTYSAGGKTIENENTDVDTKYTRSLDDIKEEYSNWLYDQKKNKKGAKRKKQLLIATAVLVLTGSFATIKFFFTGQPALPISEQKFVPPENPINNNNTNNTGKITTLAKKKIKTQSASLKNNKKELPNALKKPGKKNKGVINSNEVPTEKDIVQVDSPKDEIKNRGETGSGSVSLPQLVNISGIYSPDYSNGIRNLKITVKNNSDEVLNVVAVDVIYYSHKGSIAGKKVLYFSNLSPQESMTLTAPDNKKAEDVHFQLGLLSSEDGAIYYAKQ